MGDVVNVEVGSGNGSRSFHVKKSRACSVSNTFARFFADHDADDTIYFEYEDSSVFELFCSWLDIQQPRSPPDLDVYEREPWVSRTAQAWLLAARLEAPGFANFCLESFIRNCALSPIGPWPLIEQEAGLESPLRRFSNHWVAWNMSLLLPGEASEYDGLAATTLASQVDGYTGDPRGYVVAHWYSDCSDQVAPRCCHNPKVMEEEERRGWSPSPPPPEEEGQSIEMQRMRSGLVAAPSASQSPPMSPTLLPQTRPPSLYHSPPISPVPGSNHSRSVSPSSSIPHHHSRSASPSSSIPHHHPRSASASPRTPRSQSISPRLSSQGWGPVMSRPSSLPAPSITPSQNRPRSPVPERDTPPVICICGAWVLAVGSVAAVFIFLAVLIL